MFNTPTSNESNQLPQNMNNSTITTLQLTAPTEITVVDSYNYLCTLRYKA